jgi:hypothetical protein
MKVNAHIDCSTTLLTAPTCKVISQLNASVHFPADDSAFPSLSLPYLNTPIVFACNTLAALCGLEIKDIPPDLTTRQLYGWLVCLTISRAFGIKIGLTIEVPTGPDPRD